MWFKIFLCILAYVLIDTMTTVLAEKLTPEYDPTQLTITRIDKPGINVHRYNLPKQRKLNERAR